ncbi:MAG: response regulator [Halobacteria archaeon]|nr:response regulator [Halobacteria archaeon]
MIRAVVVDDSQFMRSMISRILEESGEDIEVVTTASNGEKGVEAVVEHQPDVVTMNLEMPRMNGVEAIEEIMEKNPTPILLVSATSEDDAERALRAFDRGAVDFLQKPDGEVSVRMSEVSDELVRKVQRVAHANIREASSTASKVEMDIEMNTVTENNPTVVIGASTGGPKEIEEIVQMLPTELGARLLIVQHMPDEFTEKFANRLDSMSGYDIREARDGDKVRGGSRSERRPPYGSLGVRGGNSGTQPQPGREGKLRTPLHRRDYGVRRRNRGRRTRRRGSHGHG